MRAAASHRPRSAPCSARAPKAYSLHDGANRHRSPSSGLTKRRYPAMGSINSRAGKETRPLCALPGLSEAVLSSKLLSAMTDVCPNLSPQQSSDNLIQISGKIWMARQRRTGVCAHHKKATARKGVEVATRQLPEPTLHPVSRHRRTNRPAYDKSDLSRFVGPHRQYQQVADHGRAACPGAVTYGGGEIRAPPHPGRMRQNQALSFSRPLRLRAASTARPARVRMRSRKPCVFARRRLFGWNVRLLTGAPGINSEWWGIGRVPRRRTRLPSGTLSFARRPPPPGLRLWKAILPKLPRLPCAAGMSRAQHVDRSVDRELALAAGARGAHR